MVHCIHSNQHNQKKETNYLEIDELNEEMMMLSTKDNGKNSIKTISTVNDNSKKSIGEIVNIKTEKDSQIITEPEDKKFKSQAFSVLSYDQVRRLHNVIEQIVPINGRGNFPTLDIKVKDLIKVVRSKLENEQSIHITDIRLNGGAASYVLQPENSSYNDLDLIFAVNLSDHKSYDKIRTAVLDSLLEFLPEGANRNRISLTSLKDAYIHKMVKVNEKVDKWSLISLSNNRGRNVELKFVDTMTRQFEFSVDSFHIILDSLIKFYECSEMPINENIYPTVLAESVYGDFNEALSHLVNKVIATRKVEEIRGGGLLKYISLLIRNYTPSEDKKKLERYMCSRFFIDFSELPAQRNKLESYLANHFVGDDWTKTQYLTQLYKVVDESTVCLMDHDRRQTLALIEEMAYCFYIRSQQQTTQQHAPHHHYSFHFQHVGKQANQPFFPHIHHHLIRPHFDFDLIVASQQQASQSNNKSTLNSDSNTPTKNSSSTATLNNCTIAERSTNNSTNNSNLTNPTSAQLSHLNNHQNNSTTTASNNSNNKNQSQQQHIQQQYHAYLFGTGANTFYHYNPHHHNVHHQHNGCFNSMSCQCGVWMACA